VTRKLDVNHDLALHVWLHHVKHRRKSVRAVAPGVLDVAGARGVDVVLVVAARLELESIHGSECCRTAVHHQIPRVLQRLGLRLSPVVASHIWTRLGGSVEHAALQTPLLGHADTNVGHPGIARRHSQQRTRREVQMRGAVHQHGAVDVRLHDVLPQRTVGDAEIEVHVELRRGVQTVLPSRIVATIVQQHGERVVAVRKLETLLAEILAVRVQGKGGLTSLDAGVAGVDGRLYVQRLAKSQRKGTLDVGGLGGDAVVLLLPVALQRGFHQEEHCHAVRRRSSALLQVVLKEPNDSGRIGGNLDAAAVAALDITDHPVKHLTVGIVHAGELAGLCLHRERDAALHVLDAHVQGAGVGVEALALHTNTDARLAVVGTRAVSTVVAHRAVNAGHVDTGAVHTLTQPTVVVQMGAVHGHAVTRTGKTGTRGARVEMAGGTVHQIDVLTSKHRIARARLALLVGAVGCDTHTPPCQTAVVHGADVLVVARHVVFVGLQDTLAAQRVAEPLVAERVRAVAVGLAAVVDARREADADTGVDRARIAVVAVTVGQEEKGAATEEQQETANGKGCVVPLVKSIATTPHFLQCAIVIVIPNPNSNWTGSGQQKKSTITTHPCA
jgi:hypothetical protein